LECTYVQHVTSTYKMTGWWWRWWWWNAFLSDAKKTESKL